MGFSKRLTERLVKKNQWQRNGESPENQRDWLKVGTMTTSGLERGGGIFKIWSPKPLRTTLHRGCHPRKGIAWPCKEELLFSIPQSSFSWGTNKRQKRAENECGETENQPEKKVFRAFLWIGSLSCLKGVLFFAYWIKPWAVTKL